MRLSIRNAHPGPAPAACLSLMFALTLSLACGGGMGDGPAALQKPAPAASTTVTVAGTLGGTAAAPRFNQQAVQSSSAAVTVNGQAATAASLQPGVVVVGKATRSGGGFTLQSVDVVQELRGPISAVDPAGATLTVLGTRVTVNALTRLEQEGTGHTFTTLTFADFAVGDVVSVFGSRQADGSVLATRIEREAPGAPGQVELRGTATALDATAKTFMLGTNLVSYAAATVTGTLAEGARVEVEGTLAGPAITASRVHVEDGSEHHLEAEVEASGPIANLDTAAKTFTLLLLKVNYSAAVVEGALVAGATVEVEGAMSATDPTLLLATKVEVHFPGMGNGASDDEAKGPITALNGTDLTLSVGGITYWTDAQTLILDDDTATAFAQLKVGDWVEVRALTSRTNAAGQPYATRIEREAGAGAGAGMAMSLEGLIGTFSATAQSFVVGGQTVAVTASTQYKQGHTTLTSAEFWGADRTGARVEVEGQPSGTGFNATEIRLKP